MGWVDLGILVVLVGSAVLGYRRGLVRQVLELIGLAGGILLALYLAGGVAKYTGALAHYRITYPLVFLGIVGVCLLVAQALGRVTSEIMEVTFFGGFDRIGGAGAGLLKGALWLSIWITILVHAGAGHVVESNLRRSSLAGPLSRLLPAAYDIVKQYAPERVGRDPFRPLPRTARSSLER